MISQAFPRGDDGEDDNESRQIVEEDENSHLYNVAEGVFGGKRVSPSGNTENHSERKELSSPPQSPTFQNITDAAETPSRLSNHLPTAIPLEIVCHDNLTVFEDLVGKIESFLLEAFQNHPTLSALISSNPSHTLTVAQNNSYHDSAQTVLSSTIKHMKCPISENILTPVKGPHHGNSSASPLSVGEFLPASSSICEFSPADTLVSGATQGNFILPASPTTNLKSPFTSSSNVLSSVVVVKDFPVPFPSVQPPARTFGPPLSGDLSINHRLQYSALSSASSYVMRVEIHYRDDQHEIAKNHGLPLFLVARQKPAGRSGKREHSSPASGFVTQNSLVQPPVSPSDSQNTFFPHFRERSAEGVDVDVEEVEFWTAAAHSHQSQSSFHLSVLWTAVNNIFGDGGALQIDLQHVFHRHQAGIGPASAVHPPSYLRSGASLRLPSIFTLPTTAIPCFATNASVHHLANGIGASASGVHTNDVEGFSRYDAYSGLSSIYTPFSEYHKNLLSAVSQGPLSSSDTPMPTSLSFSVGNSGTVTSSGGSAMPLMSPQPKLITEFWDLPTLSTSSLPPINVCQPSSNLPNNSAPSAVSQTAFSLGGNEMVRYLVECFRLQIGPRARLHVWRQGWGDTNSAAMHISSARSSSTRRGTASTNNSKEEPFCCVSIRKNYRLQLRRSPSGAAAALQFGWANNNDTTWEGKVSTFNTVLRRRCGSTTYPIGVMPRPVDYISFNFQWHQLGEEDAAVPDTLDPFHFLVSQRSHSSGHGEDGNTRHVNHPTQPLSPTVVETCTIKARAVLRKREDCQNKAARNIQAILRRYLQVLRRSSEVPYVKKGSMWGTSVGSRPAAQNAEGVGEIRAHSSAKEHHNSEGYNIHFFEIKETVQKLMRQPDVEPDVQAAMVLALVDSNNATTKIGASNGPDSGKSISILMEEEPSKNSKKGQTPRSMRVSTVDETEEKIIAAREASELAALLEDIGPAISPSPACILSSPSGKMTSSPSRASLAASTVQAPHREASISRSVARGDDQTAAGVSSPPPNNPASPQNRAINDIRLGYIPGSFLCRLAFYAGDLLATCESDEVEDEGLSALMDTWHACLDEFESLLSSSRTEPEHARKKLESLLLVLGLPNRRGAKQTSAVDLTQSLLVQKLQFLFYCIRHLHSQAASSSARSTNVDPRRGVRGVDGNVSVVAQLEGSRLLEEENPLEEWYPELLQMKEAQQTSDDEDDDYDDDNNKRMGCNRVASARGPRMGSHTLTLITNGERLIAPPPLPHPPSTSDILFQQSTLPLNVAEVGVVPFAKLCTFSVYNDMCLFLYVNQGRVVRFPDFVQWVSPRDFQRPTKASRDDNDYLSDRMKVPAAESIWCGEDEKSAATHKVKEELLALPAFTSPGEEGVEDEHMDQHMQSTSSAYGHNNVWWALWRRATPRPPAQILSDSLHHYDQAVELLHWLRTVSPATLCLELAQATVANAIHRLLVGPNVVDPSSTPFNNACTSPSLKSFLQKKTQSIFKHLAPITSLLTMSSVAPAAFQGRPVSSGMGADDGEIAKLALEEAVWEVYDMEIAVCAAMELEDSISREYRTHHPHNINNASIYTDRAYGECMETARILGSPSISQPSGGGDRLHLSVATVSVDAWKQGFATLFEKGKERVPLDTTVRLTSLAERPAGTSPCFQQLTAHTSNSVGTVHMSVCLSKEII